MKTLLNCKITRIDRTRPYSPFTPLQLALHHSHKKVIDVLLAYGAKHIPLPAKNVSFLYYPKFNYTDARRLTPTQSLPTYFQQKSIYHDNNALLEFLEQILLNNLQQKLMLTNFPHIE